jgi:hypothetical protein
MLRGVHAKCRVFVGMLSVIILNVMAPEPLPIFASSWHFMSLVCFLNFLVVIILEKFVYRLERK